MRRKTTFTRFQDSLQEENGYCSPGSRQKKPMQLHNFGFSGTTLQLLVQTEIGSYRVSQSFNKD
jgi:hypothetical protein